MVLWFAEFTCPSTEPGVFAHPCDCTMGILCANGKASETGCADGLYFNPETFGCDQPEDSDCDMSGFNPFNPMPPVTDKPLPAPTPKPTPAPSADCGQCIFTNNTYNSVIVKTNHLGAQGGVEVGEGWCAVPQWKHADQQVERAILHLS